MEKDVNVNLSRRNLVSMVGGVATLAMLPKLAQADVENGIRNIRCLVFADFPVLPNPELQNKFFAFDTGLWNGHIMSNCIVKMGKFNKDPYEPLLIEGMFEHPQKKWEPRFDNGYPNVIWDPQAKLYRLYYTLFIKDDASLNTPPAKRKNKPYVISKRRTGLAYAQSKDGIHWEKPALGLVEFEGTTQNNLLMTDVQGTGVLLDQNDPDPTRRYKLITLSERKGKASLAVAFSQDGIHFSELMLWSKESQSPVPGGDCHNSVFIDPRSKEYVLITRLWDNNVRVSAISHSKDFINWTPPQEIARGRGFNDQIYSMPVFAYHGLYLGLASIFHDGDSSLPNADTVDLTLYWTTTLSDFMPVSPETDSIFIPHGNKETGYPSGKFDSSIIFSALPLEQDNKLIFYYMGGKGKHTGWRQTALGRGYIFKDKFAYYTARDINQPCIVTTQGLMFKSNKAYLLLYLAKNEHCEVALLDRNGKKIISGFEFDKSRLIKNKDGWYEITWENSPYASLDKNKFYSLQIKLMGGKLLAIKGDLYPRPLKYTRYIV